MSKRAVLEELYQDRKLSDGYPDLERLGVEFQASSQGSQEELLYTPAFMQCVESLIDLRRGGGIILQRVLNMGCFTVGRCLIAAIDQSQEGDRVKSGFH